MANVLNVTYNVFKEETAKQPLDETELDTATFINESDLSDEELPRNHKSQSTLDYKNCSPISAQLTGANSSYFVKNNLVDADRELDSISTLCEQPQPSTTFLRQNSFRKYYDCTKKLCKKVVKPLVHKLSSKRSTTSSKHQIDTSEELSTISGLHYTSNTPSISQLTFDDENNMHFNREYEYLERFQKVRLSSTKYETMMPIPPLPPQQQAATTTRKREFTQRVNKYAIDNYEQQKRNFANSGDFVLWDV